METEHFILLSGAPLEGRSGHDAAYALLARLYRHRTGTDSLPPIARTDRGKPFFVGSALHFSISHTKSHAFCALSDVPIGIDAEELGRKIDLQLADKILSPGERAQYDAAPDKRVSLLRFWVLKEADAKRSGLGLRGYPDHTNFSLDDPRILIHDNCVLAILTEGDIPCSLTPMPI